MVPPRPAALLPSHLPALPSHFPPIHTLPLLPFFHAQVVNLTCAATTSLDDMLALWRASDKKLDTDTNLEKMALPVEELDGFPNALALSKLSLEKMDTIMGECGIQRRTHDGIGARLE